MHRRRLTIQCWIRSSAPRQHRLRGLDSPIPLRRILCGINSATLAATYPVLALSVTERTHCIAWSDYDTQPQVEFNHGIRLDTNYYYWPESWIANRPGMFTGSGMPMRFAKAGWYAHRCVPGCDTDDGRVRSGLLLTRLMHCLIRPSDRKAITVHSPQTCTTTGFLKRC